MSTSFQMPQDIPESGGAFLVTPGTFHALITEIKDNQGPKGNPIDGFTFTVHILAGNVPDCAGKIHQECMFAPKLTSSDGGKFQSQQHAALYVASNLVDPSARGQRVEIDREKMQDMQVIIRLEKDTYNSTDDKTFLRMAGVSVHHVDDPRVEKIPKDKDALELIDKKYRHDRAWFDQLIKKRDGAGNGSGGDAGGGGNQQGKKVDLDDL